MNKVVMITGASGGIGQGIATLFLDRGFDALLHTRTKPDVLVAFKKRYPHQTVVPFVGDLTDSTVAMALVQTAIDHFGKVDVLVNNAGLKIDAPIETMTDDTFKSVLDVNLTSVFYLIKAVVPIMKKQNHGAIVNIGSGIGYQGRAFNTNYAASKAALIGLTPSLAKELGEHQIRVNAVAPGLIPTEMTSYYSLEDQENYRQTVPLKRLATPLDIANAVYFLASDDAAFISGQTLFVNGGTQTH